MEAPTSPIVTDAQGYYFPDPITLQGTPAGDYFNVLLRGLTHKLNNFLAVIRGFSELILMSDGLDAAARENLDHMKQASTGAGTLAERILSASGNVRLTMQPINLGEYIPLIETTLRSPFTKANVSLQINVTPGIPPVLADNARLKEVLSELLSNAADAVSISGKPGGASLEVLPPGHAPGGSANCVDIFVRNTGSTIPREKLKEIFRPFMSTRDSKHYGIGLTIAHMLANQMGMRLGVKSENDETTFWLSAPVA